jgi:hypothetical protein
VEILRGPSSIPAADPSQANEADADEDTDTNDDDDEGSIDEWSTKDLEYTSIDGGEHPRMGWVVNDPLSTDYYEIIIPDPTYTTRRLIITPFISYSIQPFKAKVSATYGKGYHIVTHTLTPTRVPYHFVPATPAHIALLNTAPISDAIQSVVNTHFPTHLNATFKHYCHFQEQKYAAQGRIQHLKDCITNLQELENSMMEKAMCVLSEMEDTNFWGRLYTCDNQVLLCLGLIFVSHIYLFHISISSLLPCVLPACFSASTGLISDLAIISILSSYVPIMHHVTHFPLLYRHSHAYISFSLMTLYDSSPLYTSRATQFSTD